MTEEPNKPIGFYGGILQKILRRDVYYPLDYATIQEELEFNQEFNTGAGSAINEDDYMFNFLMHLHPKLIDVIEIGTFMGLGTSILASFSQTVFTFDIWYRNAHPLWVKLELDDRINCYAGEQQFIDDVISSIKDGPDFNFNFAFIDGMHKVENVMHDFENVNFCGRVLFHDADIPEIGEFIKSIGGTILSEEENPGIGTFGYWEKI